MTMPHQFEPDELLEYETQQEAVPDNPTVPVRVEEPVVTVPTVPHHMTCKTIVLTDANPVQILPLDALRVRALISVKTNDVVLCHSLTQAQDPANADNALARPNGAIIPAGLMAPVEITATGPAWLVANTFPTRIGLVIERRGA